MRLRGRRPLCSSTAANHWILRAANEIFAGRRPASHANRVIAGFRAATDAGQPVYFRRMSSAVMRISCLRQESGQPSDLPLAVDIFERMLGKTVTPPIALVPREINEEFHRKGLMYKHHWARRRIPEERRRRLLAAAIEAHTIEEHDPPFHDGNTVVGSSLLSMYPMCEVHDCSNAARYGSPYNGCAVRCDLHQLAMHHRVDVNGIAVSELADRLMSTSPYHVEAAARAYAYAFEFQGTNPAKMLKRLTAYFRVCIQKQHFPPEGVLLTRWILSSAGGAYSTSSESRSADSAISETGGATILADGDIGQEFRGYNPSVGMCLRAVLKACGIVGGAEAAGHIYRASTLRDVVPASELLPSLVWVYARCGNVESAFKLSEEAETLGLNVQRDARLISILIHACSLAGKPWKAKNTYDNAVERGLIPTQHVLDALIDAFARKGLVLQASRVFEDIKTLYADDSKVISRSLGTLLSACSNDGDVERAFDIYSKNERWNINPSIFNHLVGAAARAGSPLRAEQALNLATNAGIKPGIAMINGVLTAFSGSREPRATFVAYQRLIKSLKPNRATIHALLVAATRTPSTELAQRALDIAQNFDLPIGHRLKNWVLTCYVAEAEMDTSRCVEVSPDVQGGLSLLHTILSMYDEGISDGVEWILPVRRKLLSLCIKTERMDAAYVLLKEMLSRDERIEEDMLEQLMRAEDEIGAIDLDTLTSLRRQSKKKKS